MKSVVSMVGLVASGCLCVCVFFFFFPESEK
jgi:hypothetical protein